MAQSNQHKFSASMLLIWLCINAIGTDNDQPKLNQEACFINHIKYHIKCALISNYGNVYEVNHSTILLLFPNRIIGRIHMVNSVNSVNIASIENILKTLFGSSKPPANWGISCNTPAGDSIVQFFIGDGVTLQINSIPTQSQRTQDITIDPSRLIDASMLLIKNLISCDGSPKIDPSEITKTLESLNLVYRLIVSGSDLSLDWCYESINYTFEEKLDFIMQKVRYFKYNLERLGIEYNSILRANSTNSLSQLFSDISRRGNISTLELRRILGIEN